MAAVTVAGLLTVILSVVRLDDAAVQLSTPLLDDFLLATDSLNNSIFQLNTDSAIYRLPITDPHQPVAIGYDWASRDVYWTARSPVGAVMRYSLTAGDTATVHTGTSNVSRFDGVVVDVVGRSVYVTDSGLGEVWQRGLQADNTTLTYIDRDKTSKPHAIALDVTNRLLYWTDTASPAAVYVCPVSGGSKSRLVQLMTSSPFALAIDFHDGQMYVGDNMSSLSIERYLLNGSGNLTIARSVRPAAVCVDANFLYFSDWATNAIQQYDRQTNTQSNLLDFATTFNGLHVYHSTEVNRTAAPIYSTATTTALTTSSSSSLSSLSSPTTTSEVSGLSSSSVVIVAVVVSVIGTTLLVVVVSVLVTRACRRRRQPPMKVTPSTTAIASSYEVMPTRGRTSDKPPPLPALRPTNPCSDPGVANPGSCDDYLTPVVDQDTGGGDYVRVVDSQYGTVSYDVNDEDYDDAR